MNNNVVEVQGLTYRYPGGQQPAVDGLDFEICEGEVFGFLGPNGSGKSTTQKVLSKILVGFEGSVSVFGKDLRHLGSDFYNQVGVCFEFPNLYHKLTAEENLGFYRDFFDVPTDSPAEVLERLDLPVGDRRKIGQFSKGMKMRVVLARSLVNRPKLWFLDEPTGGQDPEHAVMIRKLIRQRADAGTTVFLTTHNMTVADELCDRVAFLVEGRIRLIDTPRRLKLEHANKIARVEYRSDNGIATEQFRLDDEQERHALAELIRQRPIDSIHSLEPTLEDVFLKVTGNQLK